MLQVRCRYAAKPVTSCRKKWKVWWNEWLLFNPYVVGRTRSLNQKLFFSALLWTKELLVSNPRLQLIRTGATKVGSTALQGAGKRDTTGATPHPWTQICAGWMDRHTHILWGHEDPGDVSSPSSQVVLGENCSQPDTLASRNRSSQSRNPFHFWSFQSKLWLIFRS